MLLKNGEDSGPTRKGRISGHPQFGQGRKEPLRPLLSPVKPSLSRWTEPCARAESAPARGQEQQRSPCSRRERPKYGSPPQWASLAGVSRLLPARGETTTPPEGAGHGARPEKRSPLPRALLLLRRLLLLTEASQRPPRLAKRPCSRRRRADPTPGQCQGDQASSPPPKDRRAMALGGGRTAGDR